MNSKLLFVGKYARNASNSKKSPKTSPKKSPNRKSKSKYEDISLGLVVKKQNKLESNRNDKINTDRSINARKSINTLNNNVQPTTISNSREKKHTINAQTDITKNELRHNKTSSNKTSSNKTSSNKTSSNNKHNTIKSMQKKSKNISRKIVNELKLNKPPNIDQFKIVKVDSNTDLYENINKYYNPILFKHNIGQAKYYKNFPKEDRYLSTVISYGLDIKRRYQD